MANINVSSAIGVAGGPNFAVAAQLAVDAYEVINVTVPKGQKNLAQVNLQPGAAGQVQLFYLASDLAPSLVKYAVGATGNVPNAANIALDQPLLLLGTGAIGLLGAAPQVLVLDGSATTQDEHLTVLVGRKVT
jgi:hypothetical protein